MSRNIPQRYYKIFQMNENEEILELIRQSLPSIWYKIAIGVVLILAPFFLMFYLISQGPVGSSIFAALLVLAVFYIFREWYLWTRKAVIITNQRIIDIDQSGLMRRSVTEISHRKVQDISYHLRGFFGTIFGVGAILIKTSVPDLSLSIQRVPKIKIVCSRLNEIVEPVGERVDERPMTSADKMRNFEAVMSEDLEKYDRYELKDLIEKYVKKYSRAQLKKFLYDELTSEESEENN